MAQRGPGPQTKGADQINRPGRKRSTF